MSLEASIWDPESRIRLLEAIIKRPLTVDEKRYFTRGHNTWDTRDPESGRHVCNGHILELAECDWRCQLCGHTFDAASDAELFECGENCTGKH